ncbi:MULTISPECIES: inner membrane-spanning protein YciB [Novosphingobium]|uniref:Inner membrane-spanning protein YciB n=1 Tax=Novosphingobium pentaromativorans US6-1 TaxID=1088721 RepID=G6EEZ1_9SPHN|nr:MULTISPECIES: inner membrane-spanning protein YciB [Novosphingobium]AIT79287.1 septation protein A [Novosphingobium pentaromativorans US6-1]EHJ60117.1 intracellular septation protein A [Novosphingobium pentaromativorans US6-1]GFM27703.1 intracellular septation protein A [Novosphingobium sp. PY1]CCA92332.1 intracellular septation protein A [Novosphingobium sp. PP1Y]
MTQASPAKAEEKPRSSWLNLVVDYGPLLIFFLAYRHYSPADSEDSIATVAAVIKGTLAFMAATVIALVVSKWRLGHISPMLWLTTVLIVGFGALTVIFHDPLWIMIKPTAVYLMFSGVLFIGLWRGKPMLKYLLQSAFEGLDETGWMKLSRNWAWFFLFLAVLNTALVYAKHIGVITFDTWLQAKLWGFTVISFLFTFSQLPMVLRHGMGETAKEELIENPPHD